MRLAVNRSRPRAERIPVWLTAAVCLASLLVCCPASRAGGYLVQPKPGAVLESSDWEAALGVEVRRGDGRTCDIVDAAGLPPGASLPDPKGKIDRSEPDVPARAFSWPYTREFDRQWGLHNRKQQGGEEHADVSALLAWTIRTSALPIVIGVVDTGVDWRHPDLVRNIFRNESEVQPNGLDEDQNGFVDDYVGFDAIRGAGSAIDDDGHGTAIAGIIAGRGSRNAGMAGLAWDARVVPCRAFKHAAGEPEGGLSDVIECWRYLVSRGAKVINNSWGIQRTDCRGIACECVEREVKAMEGRQVLLVVAAGNRGADLGDAKNATFPASFPESNILAVAATNSADHLAALSNFNEGVVDLGAPGFLVYSAVRSREEPDGTRIAQYAWHDGTSFAAPFVTAAAALVWAACDKLTAVDVKQRLMDTGDELDDLDGKVSGGRRLNTYAALNGLDAICRSRAQAAGAESSASGSGRR